MADDVLARKFKPDGGMPMWYYRCSRNFRYAVPTDFDFAYIDNTGEIVISGPFVIAKPFKDGKASIKISNYVPGPKGWQFADQSPVSARPATLEPDGKITLVQNVDRSAFEPDKERRELGNLSEGLRFEDLASGATSPEQGAAFYHPGKFCYKNEAGEVSSKGLSWRLLILQMVLPRS